MVVETFLFIDSVVVWIARACRMIRPTTSTKEPKNEACHARLVRGVNWEKQVYGVGQTTRYVGLDFDISDKCATRTQNISPTNGLFYPLPQVCFFMYDIQQ